MVNLEIIKNLVELEDKVVPTLFKPVQFNVIKKFNQNKRLSENEKRYLRGNIKSKLKALDELINVKSKKNELSIFLNNIDSYYITGLAALKHNGYGWFYEPKVIEVINTKIKGKIALKNFTIKFIRVKSISKSRFTMDKETGLRYATNEQIIEDVSFTKNNYTKSLWNQMLSRYKKMFIKGKFPKENIQVIDYPYYGV